MKVLVVDPSSAVRARLVARLRDGGLDVIAEVSGHEDALAVIDAVDAIVLDVVLGLQVLAALRRAAPGATIMVLTNATHYRRRCLDAGADHFLDKSSEFDAVVATLSR